MKRKDMKEGEIYAVAPDMPYYNKTNRRPFKYGGPHPSCAQKVQMINEKGNPCIVLLQHIECTWAEWETKTREDKERKAQAIEQKRRQEELAIRKDLRHVWHNRRTIQDLKGRLAALEMLSDDNFAPLTEGDSNDYCKVSLDLLQTLLDEIEMLGFTIDMYHRKEASR